MKKYIWALDISLRNTGGAIFDDNGNYIFGFSVPTEGDEIKDRLRALGDTLLSYLKEYPCKLLIMENGFMRFHRATQILYRCFGVVNYLFSNVEQIYYAPTTIKKVIAGSGKATKEDVASALFMKYPDAGFTDEDQSDACAVGVTYFEKEVWK